jgi:hypothetical protein
MICWFRVRDDPRLSVVTPGPTDHRRNAGPLIAVAAPWDILEGRRR